MPPGFACCTKALCRSIQLVGTVVRGAGTTAVFWANAVPARNAERSNASVKGRLFMRKKISVAPGKSNQPGPPVLSQICATRVTASDSACCCRSPQRRNRPSARSTITQFVSSNRGKATADFPAKTFRLAPPGRSPRSKSVCHSLVCRDGQTKIVSSGNGNYIT